MMNLTKCIGLVLLSLCVPCTLFAQLLDTTQHLSTIDYQLPKTYEIGGISVKGANWSEAAALKNIAGFQVGDQLEIPSPMIPAAIKRLWKLGLFSDIQIYQTTIEEEIVHLEIQVVEVNRLGSITIKGVKKSELDALHSIVQQQMHKGRKLTAPQKSRTLFALRNHFIEKGYADVAITLQEIPDTTKANFIDLVFTIDKKEKVKVTTIVFQGNAKVAAKKLKKLLGIKTNRQLLASSKLIQAELVQGKKAIIGFYNTLGYLDAKIFSDTVYRQDAGDWHISLTIQEGRPYYFGNIIWKGNTIYSTAFLAAVLDIKKGAVFDENRLNNQLRFSMEGLDISGLYMDNGYLFFQVEAIQTAIRKDTIDLEIRMVEGPQAIVDKVIIKGNNRTNEHVIRRELRTQPGKRFSRADVIRSQRELINLGYFNPESLNINTPVNPERGTVDIEYTVEEKPSDRFELAGGWGGASVGLTGTIGVTLNNFSLRNILTPQLWNPLPRIVGDGQRTSLRLQSNGKAYQSINVSFTEPWLGGKKPNSLTTSLFYTRYFGDAGSSAANRLFKIFGASGSLGSRLTFPDDNFIANTEINYERYQLNNWVSGLFRTNEGQVITDGTYNNLSLTQTIARSTINHSIFPTTGSKFSLSLQLTAPYSLFSKKDYSDLNAVERYQWLEYHKWRFNAEWYKPVTGKLVLKMAAKIGFVGTYNKDIGVSPFERFQLGGDGFSNAQGGFTGTDVLSLRGYEVEDLENNWVDGNTAATPIFNKFTAELRYPIFTNSNTTMYGLAFLEAGNSFQTFKDYNPFDVKRSAGVGLRVFLPMFGTLGFDYGVGFDKPGEKTWSSRGKFSIILGFEPE